MAAMNPTGTEGTGPIGRGDHVVRQGECISSIADRYGLFWETIWNDAGNAELKETRKNPDLLLPGDRLVIPDKRRKEESGATEQRHRFRRLGVPIDLVIRILKDRSEWGAYGHDPDDNDDDSYNDAPAPIESRGDPEPEANEPYSLEIDGRTLEGSTDGDGILRERISPAARSGRLVLRRGQTDERVIDLLLGQMDPVSEPIGAAKRLCNLGYRCRLDRTVTESIAAALKAFQADQGLDETGRLDGATQDILVSAHGS